MSELPEGWVEAQLGALSQFVMGQAPPGSASNFDSVGAPFVKAGEFGVERPIIREWTTQPLKMAEEGDVLICVVGATSGKINLGANCAIGRSVAAIRPSSGLDQFYLYEFMKTKVDELRRGSTGTAQGVISSVMLAEIGIPLAPLPEQRRIVAKVDALTARTARARADLSRIPTLIARYKQRLLALAFSGELTAGWRKRQQIPWKDRQRLFFDLVPRLTAGKNLRCEERPPATNEKGVVKISAVTWGEFDPSASKTLPKHFEPSEKTLIKNGDLLVSRANTLELVGAVALVKDAPANLYLSDKVLRMETADEHKPWVLWFLRSPEGRRQIEKWATGNQLSMRNISQKSFNLIEFPWPHQKERREIVRRIESAFGWLDRMAADHAAAARLIPKLDAAILTKAFRGDLVPQDPTDEPASVLLERIKAEREADASKPKRVRRQPKKMSALQGIESLKAALGRPLQTNGPPLDSKSFEEIADEVMHFPERENFRPPISRSRNMTKSRQDEDVKGKPYLAALLKSVSPRDVESLFHAADLPVADFYKQLAWEIQAEHIIDNPEVLRAA